MPSANGLFDLLVIQTGLKDKDCMRCGMGRLAKAWASLNTLLLSVPWKCLTRLGNKSNVQLNELTCVEWELWELFSGS